MLVPRLLKGIRSIHYIILTFIVQLRRLLLILLMMISLLSIVVVSALVWRLLVYLTVVRFIFHQLTRSHLTFLIRWFWHLTHYRTLHSNGSLLLSFVKVLPCASIVGIIHVFNTWWPLLLSISKRKLLSLFTLNIVL